MAFAHRGAEQAVTMTAANDGGDVTIDNQPTATVEMASTLATPMPSEW